MQGAHYKDGKPVIAPKVGGEVIDAEAASKGVGERVPFAGCVVAISHDRRFLDRTVGRGTRPSVELIIDVLVHGWTKTTPRTNYSGLILEDVRALPAPATVAW